MPTNNKVAAATSLLKILARIDRLEEEVRVRREESNLIELNDVRRVQKIVFHGVSTMQKQYIELGETLDELQNLSRDFARFVESNGNRNALDFLKYERIFDCEE